MNFERGKAMLNLKKLRTKEGGIVKVVFEDDKMMKEFEQSFNQEEVQKQIDMEIAENGKDPGKGGTVFLLINSQCQGEYFTQSEYDKWSETEEKDWFHLGKSFFPPHIRAMLESAILFEMFGIDTHMFPGNFGIVIQDYSMANENSERHSGPSVEQLKEIGPIDLTNPNLVEILLTSRCEACPNPDCYTRKSSFDMEAFKKALEPMT